MCAARAIPHLTTICLTRQSATNILADKSHCCIFRLTINENLFYCFYMSVLFLFTLVILTVFTKLHKLLRTKDKS